MQTEDSIKSIISKVDYLDWTIRLGEMGDGWFIQVQFLAPDSDTGKPEIQHCRKWYISKWMSDTEVVDTIYAAFERAILHEFNETFRYNDRAIYNPHTNWQARYEACIRTEHRESNTVGIPAETYQKLIEKLPEQKGDVEISAEPGQFTKRLIPLMKKIVPRMTKEQALMAAQYDDGPVVIEPNIVSFCKPEEAEQYRKDAINAFHRTMEEDAKKETVRKPLPNQNSFLDKE